MVPRQTGGEIPTEVYIDFVSIVSYKDVSLSASVLSVVEQG